MDKKDVIIIGGGSAGLASALELYNRGIKDVLIVERENKLGGILKQCIHDGFGLVRFGKTLSGPEYAEEFIKQINELSIPYILNTAVIDISPDKVVTLVNKSGFKKIQCKSVILAMGCRERTRGALAIPGERPTGVFTAGVAQSYMNIYNTMVGKNVIILGSGDIGMIMARRLTLEGAKVIAVFEILPHPSGLPRNIEQCLNDYNIPLYLSHTVTNIDGDKRLKGVTVSKVDEKLNVIPNTEKYYECDTLILSVGLIPENELSQGARVAIDNRTKGAYVDENFQTSIEGIFAAGNVLHVHDLVDYVSMEGENLAKSVAKYIEGKLDDCNISIKTDNNINHTIPQKISGKNDFKLSFRVNKVFKNCIINIIQGGKLIKELKMKKAIPAEMIQVPISKDTIKNDVDIEVCVIC
ncbi:MAG: NAD(P)/FAD-dependent oxidoreductase [Fusobacteriaceae bacterium]|jgi:thioredoxin reductase|nr:NAD(P)/FAD-dependent oxidoreductase [Fusobacteriaceae bacterium]